jgi:hypothetical protein
VSNSVDITSSQASQSDATPAYRGYRLQALYTLTRLLDPPSDNGFIYQPEGQEDLAVYSNQQTLLEIAQVKQRSQNLVLSSFEPDKKDSFFPRVAAQLRNNSNAKISIVAFGEVGPELQNAIQENGTDRARVARKIANFGYVSETEAISLFDKIDLITFDEAVLRQRVFTALESSLAGVDPNSAFELLTYWLYHCAEKKSKISRQILIERINAVGRFVASRAAYHSEWFTSIIPLAREKVERDELSEEFYRGSSTRYEHILADLDVIRTQQLSEIAAKFRKTRVVIVHAASGQGKTTLSYRYLHEYFPESWCFQVRSVFDREHALRIALALKAHADALDVPLAIYLDVSSQDRNWPELVRSLSEHRNLQVLVSIREEDWKRAGILVMGFEFETVELSFERNEALMIYNSLAQKHPPANVLNAEEAWERFGGAGPLMEFIYLITQGDSLRTKLSQQVTYLKNEVRQSRLDDSEIELLRLTSIASASGARLRVKPLAEHLLLAEPQSTLKLFEKEYLLRVSAEGIHVQGLHPIRSTMLTDLLTDATFTPWVEGVASCLPFVEEEDLEIFLLHCFARHRENRSELLHTLKSYKPTKWIGIIGVVRALIWSGVAEYVEANSELIAEAVAQIGIGGWSYFIDFDIANASDGTIASWWNELDFITDEVKENLKQLQSRQTDKAQVFQHAAGWLTDRQSKPVPPATEADWSAIAETIFWIGRLKVDWPLTQWLTEAELEWAIEELPLEILANLVSGLFESGEFHNWFLTNRTRFTDRFRRDTDTVLLEDDGQRLTAQFIFALPDLVDAPSEDAQKISVKTKNTFHEAAIQRLGLLRRLFPDRGEFSTQGYGHRLWENFLEFDETIKTGVDRKHLPLVWLTSVNATFRGLGDLRFRPATWREYSECINNIRRSVLASLKQLERGIENYFRRSGVTKILGTEVNGEQWDRCKMMLMHPPQLPRVAVDEWGFLEESTSDTDTSGIAERLTQKSSLAAGRYKNFLKAFNEYTRTLSNFFTQATDCMITNPLLGRTNDRTKVLEAASSFGIKSNSCKLSTLNLADCLKNLNAFQREARKILKPFFDGHTLRRLGDEEQRTFHRIWCAWYFFAIHPEKVMQNAVSISERECLQILKTIGLELRVRLRRVSSDLIRFKIISEDALWNDRPALWLSVDSDSPLDALGSLQTVLDQIRQSVLKVAKSDLRRYVLELHWPHVVIVPLIRGKCANTVAWRIALPVITESENESLSWWNYAQSPIPMEALDQLNLKSWDLPQLSEGAKLMQYTTILFYIATHIRDFGRLPDLDEEGLTQLQAYVNRLSRHASEALQSVLDTEGEMLATFNNLSEDDQKLRPYLFESALAITDLHKTILPSEDFSNHLEMDLQSLIDWATRLEQANGYALAASSAWLSDVIDQAQRGRL